MPQDYRYTNADIPDYFAHQVRDFVRIHWHDEFQYNIHAPCLPDEWNPVHFIVGDAPALYSHAAAVSRQVTLNGQELSCGGLSAVLTYPAFRGKGFGSHVTQLSTEFIKSQPFDLALLWTEPTNNNFYAKHGWQHYENVTCQYGEKENPGKYEIYSMLMLLSARARDALKSTENNTIYIGAYGW